MGQDHNQQFQPDPKLFERLAFLQQTVECKRTDRVFTAPFVQYLPIHLYGETTVKDTMMNYENVMTIIRQRTGHKLDEWNILISELKELPYIKEIME